MKIDTKNWRKFRVGDLFEAITKTALNSFTKRDEKIDDYVIPALSSTVDNHSFGYYVKSKDHNVIDRLCLSVTSNGDAGKVYLQNQPFAIAQDAYAIYLKDDDRENIYLFIAAVLEKLLIQKYNYNNKAGWNKVKKELILLPAIDPDTPDFDYMEKYIEEMKLKYIDELEKDNDSNINKALEATGLSYEDLDKDLVVEPADRYEEFNYNDFYDLLLAPFYVGGESLSSSGKHPVYSATSDNFGIQGYSNIQPAFVVDEDNPYYIVFGDHTKTFNFAYDSFSTKDNVKTLRPKFKSKAINLYLLTVWSKAIPSLGYARHWSKAKKAKLLLPAKDKDTPDFDYMEKAIYIYILQKRLSLKNYLMKKK